MAEKTVTVRLKALVDDYKKAMSDASKATGDVAKSGDKLKTLGRDTAALGSSLTRRVTLPIVAIGAATTKLAVDFDSSFKKMQGLAGVSAKEVDGLKESVMNLAGETGRGPQELADALYFLRSSGLDGAKAMDALEVSAKAAAAGLGPTEVIADAVSSAMNAYAKSGLTAAEATDTLVATARAGKAEPAELASALGRVLPISSQLGVSFQDVGGAIASLSLSGNDAATASTQLTNVLSKLLKPSQQAEELLSGIGLSMADVQAELKQKGLLATLNDLKKRLGDSGFVKFMEDQQAVQGALALTGENAAKVSDVFDQVNHSAGATEDAFKKTDGEARDLSKAWAELQVAMIKIGDIIAPIAADIAGFAAAGAEAFGKLPEGAQKTVVVLGLLLAAMGPLLTIGGKVAENFKAIGNATQIAIGKLGKLGSVAQTAAGVAGIAALALAAKELGDQLSRPDQIAGLSELENKLLTFARTGKASGAAAKVLGADMGELSDALHRVTDPSVAQELATISSKIPLIGGDTKSIRQAKERIDELDKALASLAAKDPKAAAEAFSKISEAMVEQGTSAKQVRGQFDDYRAAVAEADTSNKTAKGSIDETSGALDDEASSADKAAASFQELGDAITAQFDPLFGMVDALNDNRDANAQVLVAQAAYTDAVKKHGKQSAAAREAEAKLSEAHEASAHSALDVTSASYALEAGVEAGTISVEDARKTLQRWVKQGIISQETANRTGLSFLGASKRADQLTGSIKRVPTHKTVAVGTKGINAARVNLQKVKDSVDRIPGFKQVEIHFAATGTAAVSIAEAKLLGHRAGGGKVSAGQPVWVGEEGQEIFVPGQDGYVIPHGQSMAMAAAGGGPAPGGGHVQVDINVLGDGLMRYLRQQVQVRFGGNVQAALGGDR